VKVVGKFADVAVIRGDTANPYDAILAATPDDVLLTIVNGVPIYGDMILKPLGPANPGCETIDLCCGPKFACVAEAGGSAVNKLGQTYPEIKAAIEDGLMQSLPADNFQQYLPIAPPVVHQRVSHLILAVVGVLLILASLANWWQRPPKSQGWRTSTAVQPSSDDTWARELRHNLRVLEPAPRCHSARRHGRSAYGATVTSAERCLAGSSCVPRQMAPEDGTSRPQSGGREGAVRAAVKIWSTGAERKGRVTGELQNSRGSVRVGFWAENGARFCKCSTDRAGGSWMTTAFVLDNAARNAVRISGIAFYVGVPQPAVSHPSELCHRVLGR